MVILREKIKQIKIIVVIIISISTIIWWHYYYNKDELLFLSLKEKYSECNHSLVRGNIIPWKLRISGNKIFTEDEIQKFKNEFNIKINKVWDHDNITYFNIEVPKGYENFWICIIKNYDWVRSVYYNEILETF